MDAEPLRLPPGIHDIPADAYHADPCDAPSLSASLCQTITTKTPRHAWAASPRLNPDWQPDDRTKFDLGTAVHEVMLGKGRGIYEVPFSDYKTQASRDARDWARSEGFTPLTQPNVDRVKAMVAAARAQLDAHPFGNPFDRIPKADKEVTLIWDQGGVRNRVLIDALDRRDRIAWDLKTTGALAEPESWVQTAMGNGIDVRSRFYLDGLETLLPGAWRYRFVVVEVEFPHCLSVVELSGQAVDFIGRKKVDRGRVLWGECLTARSWPGYTSELAIVDPRPSWEARWLERESRELDYRTRTGRDILAAALAWQAPQ